MYVCVHIYIDLIFFSFFNRHLLTKNTEENSASENNFILINSFENKFKRTLMVGIFSIRKSDA